MVSYLYRMPVGIPGDVTNSNSAHLETGLFDASAPFPGFGLPGKYSSGKFVPIGASDTADKVVGFLHREFPVQSTSNALGGGTPPTSGPCSILRRGSIVALLGGTTDAVKGGLVYIRVASASAGKPIGGIEAAADSTNTIVLPATTTFKGPAVAGGPVEISFNI